MYYDALVQHVSQFDSTLFDDVPWPFQEISIHTPYHIELYGIFFT